MIVREASAEEVEEIRAVYLRSWRAGYEGLLSESEIGVQLESRTPYDWRAAVERSNHVVLVAEESRRLIGVAHVEVEPREPGHVPWLHMLYVLPEAWGTGTALRLLGAAVEKVRRAGHRSIWLGIVEPQERAWRFYEREGWQLNPDIGSRSNGLFRLLCYRKDVMP